MSGRVVVVGAGLGGLAAAIRLAVAGCDVTLLERDATVGGRAGRLERSGYAFDLGPSVLTMPELLEELFALAGEEVSARLDLVRLDPAYRAVFHDGSVLRVRSGVEAMAAEVAEVVGQAEAGRFVGLVARLRALYETTWTPFVDRNFDSPLDLVRPGGLASLARLARLGGFRRVNALVSSHLTDWRLVRLFTFQSMYAGMSPFEALGVYAIIAYMDVIRGVYAARGGVHAVSRSLGELARRRGVDLRLSTPVERVEVRDGRAVAVRTVAGQRVPCDVVVLNPDLPVAYRDLLPPAATPRRVRRLRYAPSCVVVHLGVERRLAGAEHHNIHFARAWRGGFDDILAGRPQREESWFLSVPSVTDPALAPPGGAVAFVLLPVPNLAVAPIDWRARAGLERERALERLEAAGYGRLAGAVGDSEVVTPEGWRAYGLAAGTPFSASHHLFQTGPFRPRNLAPRVGGVVFAGAGTTPGVGVPMVLVSGKLAAQRALGVLGTRRAG